MDLKQKLSDFGCSSEFIDIALGYQASYNPKNDIELFIEYVEAEHAKVEEAEVRKSMEKEIVDASEILQSFEDDLEV